MSSTPLVLQLLAEGRVAKEIATERIVTLCAKVRPYLERVYHPDRLTHPLRRAGPKGSGEWERLTSILREVAVPVPATSKPRELPALSGVSAST